MKKYALFGYGGHAKEIASIMQIDCVFVVDDKYKSKETLGIKDINPEEYQILIALGDSKLRKKTAEKFHNFDFFTYIHPTALISKGSVIGKGSYIGPYCIVTNNVSIGNHALLSRVCQIGHDSSCGDFLSMMPGSIISGNCKIGNNNYIGNNSAIKEKIQTKDDFLLGMNSCAVKNIDESGIYVGCPCRRIKDYDMP